MTIITIIFNFAYKGGVISCGMKHSRTDLKSGLLQIGEESIFIINQSRIRSGKNDIWETAIKINSIAKKLYHLTEKEEMESRREDPTQWS